MSITTGYRLLAAVTVLATLTWSSTARAVTTNVHETWESQPFTIPFTGAGDLAWTGDVGAYGITNATWPSFHNFAGSRSLRHVITNADPDTVVTAFAFDPTRPTFWRVFVSGIGGDITSGRGFDLLLMSDSANTAAIEAGTINGYKISLGTRVGTTDSLLFQEANGSGWQTNAFLDTGFAANVNQGWNLLVFRDTDGGWRLGFSTGAVGTAVAFGAFLTDSTVLSSTVAGMSYKSPATGATAFGFDNFLITSIPEPSTALLLGGAAFLRLRR